MGAPQTPAETVSPTAPAETAEGFAEDLAAAVRRGDQRFLLDRLHPAVFDRYGRSQCASYVRGIRDPSRRFVLTDSSGPAPCSYETDDISTTIDDVHTVAVRMTADGETSNVELHFAVLDDAFTWFTDCGDPAGS